jgi:hypothetical protein
MPIRGARSRTIQPAQERDQAMPIAALIESNLWMTWLQIACERERVAGDARRRAETVEEVGSEFGEAVGQETRAAMVAVSASSHALDAFYGKVRQVGTLPPNTWSWEQNRTRQWGRILETLKHCFDIGRHGSRWAGELEWLFDLRDSAVHHTSEARPTVPHPTGRSNVSQETLDYSLEAAQRAVGVAMEVMTTCLESPRSGQPDIKTWVEKMPHVPDALRAFRSLTQ